MEIIKEDIKPDGIKEQLIKSNLEEYRKAWLERYDKKQQEYKEMEFDATIAIHLKEFEALIWFRQYDRGRVIRVSHARATKK